MIFLGRKSAWWCVPLAAWGLAVGTGFVLLGAYAATPGDSGKPPVCWPRKSAIAFDEWRWNLLIFLHPACPCSRASVEELAYITARCSGRVSTKAVLLAPASNERTWPYSAIERQLTAMPDLGVWHDNAAVEAKRFRVVTSGHVLLYDSRGRLMFSGGITGARGHVGPNYGRDALLARIQDQHDERPTSPVFGCRLTRSRFTITKNAWELFR